MSLSDIRFYYQNCYVCHVDIGGLVGLLRERVPA